MENGSSNSYHTHTYFIWAGGVDIIGTAVYSDWSYRLWQHYIVYAPENIFNSVSSNF